MPRASLLLAALLLLTGCGLGPAKLPATRMDYNIAVQRSNNEEMLLNIVRMKYFEQPLFLQVGAIASSFSYNVTGASTATLPDQRDFLRSIYNTYAPSISATYSDAPTVTYTPYQGQTYVQQFLAEVDFERFAVLYRSGWDIDYLMRILVARVGTLDHTFDTRIGFAPAQHEKFLELTKIIAAMDDKGYMDLVHVSPGKDKPSVAVLTMRFDTPEEANRVQELLGMDIKAKRSELGHLVSKMQLINIKEHALSEGAQEDPKYPLLPIRLRNCLRVMDVLAQGVQVPEPLAASRTGFDLRSQFADTCDIQASAMRPLDAFVSVKHGAYWYSIRGNDARSKEVFQLMLNLFALQSADPPKNAPVLTLPVGAN